MLSFRILTHPLQRDSLIPNTIQIVSTSTKGAALHVVVMHVPGGLRGHDVNIYVSRGPLPHLDMLFNDIDRSWPSIRHSQMLAMHPPSPCLPYSVPKSPTFMPPRSPISPSPLALQQRGPNLRSISAVMLG